MSNRRSFLQSALALGAAFTAAPKLFGSERMNGNTLHPQGAPVPVNTPDLATLPFTMDGAVKVFHLVAEPVKQEILTGRVVDLWGYNGSAPGPTIQANQGDRVRVVFDNHLPEPTSIHWHGLEIPEEMDGVPGIGQKPVAPGGRFVYEFTLHQEGTFFYHSHMAMQEMLGMLGAFILHPARAHAPAIARDHVILLQEYAILPNNTVPNTMSMEYNWLTFNGKAGPAATPMIVRQGERARIRLINLGMDHHPVHLHGFTFAITGNEGGRLPEAQWIRRNTALVGVAQAQDIEFEANTPGNWMLHCHLPHHMMNQMSSNVGTMTRVGAGIMAGQDMESGMGMLTGSGSATSDNRGPSLGRGMGVGSTAESATTNGALSEHGMQGMNMTDMLGIAKDANRVPGFPQDAYMEGPMMAMDKMVEKPETMGLPAGWSGYSGGMMTLVRVMPPDLHDRYLELKRRRSSDNMDDMKGMPGMGGNHGS
ncbi:multicopper oxidase family protein [Granulicella sp. L60]|uniref:multicopper oxidase family protein n=1 Tax=Granulicella sp. L60 TaxID=1641866 RepID=UPI00131DC2E1|nr:copper oxidase [Granulicella sp. L60]